MSATFSVEDIFANNFPVLQVKDVVAENLVGVHEAIQNKPLVSIVRFWCSIFVGRCCNMKTLPVRETLSIYEHEHSNQHGRVVLLPERTYHCTHDCDTSQGLLV